MEGVLALTFGEEFRICATPSPELLRKLAYLARQDNDSVLTGALRSTENFGSSSQKADQDRFAAFAQLVASEELHRQQQMQELSARLEVLDSQSQQAVLETQKRLEEIRRNANRTTDGRIVFEDKDGAIRDEEGTQVSVDNVDLAQWNADAPTYETFRDARERHEDAKTFRRAVLEAREKLENDPEEIDLDRLEARISELEAGHLLPAGDAPAGANTRPTSAAKTYDETAGQDGSATSLRRPFAGAVDDGTATVPGDAPDVARPSAAPLTPG